MIESSPEVGELLTRAAFSQAACFFPGGGPVGALTASSNRDQASPVRTLEFSDLVAFRFQREASPFLHFAKRELARRTRNAERLDGFLDREEKRRSHFSGRFLRGNLQIEVREEFRGGYQINASLFRASRFPTLLRRGGLDAESANWRAEIIRGRRNAQLNKRGPAKVRVRTPFLGLRQSKIRRDRHHRHPASPALFAVTCADGCGFRRYHAGKMARPLEPPGRELASVVPQPPHTECHRTRRLVLAKFVKACAQRRNAEPLSPLFCTCAPRVCVRKKPRIHQPSNQIVGQATESLAHASSRRQRRKL